MQVRQRQLVLEVVTPATAPCKEAITLPMMMTMMMMIIIIMMMVVVVVVVAVVVVEKNQLAT